MEWPPQYLIWLDLETTGLDKASSLILEIAMIRTQAVWPFDDVGEPFSSVIKPPLGDWFSKLEPVVVDMHSKNGLFTDVADHGEQESDVMADALDWLKSGTGLYPPPKSHGVMMAGSGIGHYDRPVLSHRSPKLDKFFMYPVLDVGSTRRQIELMGLNGLLYLVPNSQPHRALSDARHSLDEFRHYSEEIRNAFIGLTEPSSAHPEPSSTPIA